MNKKNIIVILLILLLLFINGKNNIINQEKLESFFKNPFNDFDFNLSVIDNLSEIEDVFGTPENINKQAIKNKHNNDIIDYIYKIVFDDDIQLSYYYSTAKNKYLLESLSIFTNKYTLKYNIKIGIKIDEIIKIFGDPSEKESNYISYKPNDYWGNSMIFEKANNKVVSIHLLSWTD